MRTPADMVVRQADTLRVNRSHLERLERRVRSTLGERRCSARDVQEAKRVVVGRGLAARATPRRRAPPASRSAPSGSSDSRTIAARRSAESSPTRSPSSLARTASVSARAERILDSCRSDSMPLRASSSDRHVDRRSAASGRARARGGSPPPRSPAARQRACRSATRRLLAAVGASSSSVDAELAW